MAADKKAIWPAAAAYLCFMMFGSLISIINSNFIILSQHFSESLTVISYMLSAMAVGRLSTIFISGIIADRFGRKKIMVLSIACVCIFYAFLPFTTDIRVGMALVAIAGMGHGMVDSAATALLFDCFPKKPDFAIGLIQAFFCLGAFSTPIITSALYNKGLYFGWLFWGLAGLGIFTALWIMIARFPGHVPRKEDLADMEASFRHKPLLADGAMVAVIALLYSLGTMTMTTWVGTYAIEITGLSEINSIQILSYYNIGCMLGTVVIARIIQKIHPTVFLIINPLAMTLLLGVYVIVGEPGLTFLMFVLIGFFAGINYSLMLSVAGEMFPKRKATVSGATMGMSAVGAIVTPVFSSYLYNGFGIAVAFNSLFVPMAVLIAAAIGFRFRYRAIKG